MAIDALSRSPEVKPYCLPVSLSGTAAGNAVAIAARRAAVAVLAGGGAIAMFPASGVGIAATPFKTRALDLQWISYTARLASMKGVSVVPVFFAGQNSWLYQAASHYSGTVRASLICYETVRMIGKRIEIAIGEPISGHELVACRNCTAMVTELRRRTFALSARPDVDWMKAAPPPLN